MAIYNTTSSEVASYSEVNNASMNNARRTHSKRNLFLLSYRDDKLR